MVTVSPQLSWFVVTGANRGLGLEFTHQLLQSGQAVAACCRLPDEAKDLHNLQQIYGDRIRLVELDVSLDKSLHGGADTLTQLPGGIHLLIHNAGIFATGEAGLENFRATEMQRVFQVNLFGPLELTRRLVPSLESTQGKVFILTSRTGALRPPGPHDRPGSQFSYPCSKAAVHRMVPILGQDLASRGIIVGGIDPGWVRTGMTAGAPPVGRYQLEPQESVRGMLNVIKQVTLESTGRLWRWNGEPSNWYAPEETPEERQEVIN